MTDTARTKARVPRGLKDTFAADAVARRVMIEKVRQVYERYGFEPLETSALEYADALGKFLPDLDRPMGGVFALKDDDDQWMALRYDLTAPLARLVAQNFDALSKPFRRYQVGPVWRNEKPGPGRFREFVQFDADTVGTPTMAADAELCLMLADSFEELGIGRGQYIVRVNNRKILNGVLEAIGVAAGAGPEADEKRLTILRAIDKLDRLGPEGVSLLLGAGRKDESGDFTKGAGLAPDQTAAVLAFVGAGSPTRAETLAKLKALVGTSVTGLEGVSELEEIGAFLDASGVGPDRVTFDPSVVRGLAYYTGPVIEAELTFEITDEEGRKVQFGSVAGGGRYDDLITRFTGTQVPATGVSIGVDRLLAALKALGRTDGGGWRAPVVVLALDKARLARSQAIVQELRGAGIAAELYLGGGGMRAQLKYADKRGAPIAVIEGEDEAAKGEVTLKDLALGAALAQGISDRQEWLKGQPAQISVARGELVSAVRAMLERSQGTALE